MGLRGYILTLLSGLAAVMLLQMGLSWFIARSMGDNIRQQSDQIVQSMAEDIRQSEIGRIEQAMLAGTLDLQIIIAETEKSTLLSSDFFSAQSTLARTSAAGTAAARAAMEQFTRELLSEYLPVASSAGATFEYRTLSNFAPYMLPFAYREGADILFNDGLTIDEESPDHTEEERAAALADELNLGYYLASVPAAHDRSRPLPVKVNWSQPYIDADTGEILISATAPMNLKGRVLGVAYIDLALSALDELTQKVAAELPQGTVALAFSAASSEVLASPVHSAWAPAEVDDPENPGQKIIQPLALAQLPFSRELAAAFEGLPAGGLKQTAVTYAGQPHTLLVENIAGLFGLAALVPDKVLFAAVDQARELARKLDENQKREMNSLTLSAAVSLALVLAALAVIILFVLRITRRLGGIVNDLTAESTDIGGLAEAASQLAAALEADAAGQSRAIADTSEAVRQITDQIRANAQATDQCGQAMNQSTGQVTTGKGAVEDMSGAMSGISRATSEIAKTLKTIETISFQTNLLALNAAVEAARAGEAGAGFAVVADEVRNLAGMTSDAARKTAELIGEATRRVTEGQVTKDRLEKGFKDIEAAVRDAAGQVELIRAATRDQAQAVDSVNSSMSELSVAVQRNADAANQSSQSSRGLSRRAGSLYGTSLRLGGLTLGRKNLPPAAKRLTGGDS
ncbi:hypothetical protein FACS189460_3020 [Deltaproteobacteria bacterium]|nr:hypothetical protein FACS189460_3020 [Deltaproteobacteria bacterium]